MSNKFICVISNNAPSSIIAKKLDGQHVFIQSGDKVTVELSKQDINNLKGALSWFLLSGTVDIKVSEIEANEELTTAVESAIHHPPVGNNVNDTTNKKVEEVVITGEETPTIVSSNQQSQPTVRRRRTATPKVEIADIKIERED